MIVPDGAVWAAIPTVSGCLLWMAKHYVQDVSRGSPDTDISTKMTVRDYKEFSAVLISELNGRYLLAEEAREHFSQLDTKIDGLDNKLANLCSTCVGNNINNRTLHR